MKTPLGEVVLDCSASRAVLVCGYEIVFSLVWTNFSALLTLVLLGFDSYVIFESQSNVAASRFSFTARLNCPASADNGEIGVYSSVSTHLAFLSVLIALTAPIFRLKRVLAYFCIVDEGD